MSEMTEACIRGCTVHGCEREADRPVVGLCEMHYCRLRRTGTTDLVDRTETLKQAEQRFLSYVEKTPTCWIWRGTVTDVGYGQFRYRMKRYVASRFAHELWVGPIPEGFEVDHVAAQGCTDTRCVNPAHLEAVTHAENLRRSTGPSAVNARKTHCYRGHEFTPENTMRSNGERICRTCRKERAK